MTYKLSLAAALAALTATAPLSAVSTTEDVAWDITEGLTTEVGQRMPGTEAEARARKWALSKLESLGFSNVREENFMMPTWVRGEETAEVIAPFQQKLHITALGNSGSTGAEPLEGEIAYFEDFQALSDAPIDEVQGKIAFVDHKMFRAQDGSGYGFAGPARWFGPNVAAKKGARAIIIRSVGTDFHRNPHTGNTNFENGVTPIPAGALSNPDADTLYRMRKLTWGKPLQVRLKLTPRNIGEQQSGNVITELPGRDQALPPILIACHLDSWDLAPSAFDDAAGCGIITAAAKKLKDQGNQPLRTIRLLWAGAEEVGLWGGKEYARKYANQPHAVAMESDFGADRVWRIEFRLPESEAMTALKQQLTQAVSRFGVAASAIPATGGADIRDIIRTQNLAIIDLQQDGTRYFDLHHTPDDTLDKIDRKQLRQNVDVWTAVLGIIANSDADFSMGEYQ